MNKAISAAILIALAALYLFGLPYVVGWWARVLSSWLPFAGETGERMYLRMSLSYVVAVVSIAVVVAAGVALRFPHAAFRFGLLLGVLPALSIARLLSKQTLTGAMQLLIVRDALILLLAPALLAWLLSCLLRRLRRPAATPPSGAAISKA